MSVYSPISLPSAIPGRIVVSSLGERALAPSTNSSSGRLSSASSPPNGNLLNNYSIISPAAQVNDSSPSWGWSTGT